MNEWIETKKQTPPEATAIIMWLPEMEHWTQGYVYDGKFYRIGQNKPIKEEVPFWMLPEPPKS